MRNNEDDWTYLDPESKKTWPRQNQRVLVERFDGFRSYMYRDAKSPFFVYIAYPNAERLPIQSVYRYRAVSVEESLQGIA